MTTTPEPTPDYQRGYRDAERWWTAHPDAVQITPRKRAWLANQPTEYRDGWRDGTTDTA